MIVHNIFKRFPAKTYVSFARRTFVIFRVLVKVQIDARFTEGAHALVYGLGVTEEPRAKLTF